ncbi:LCP family protein [Aggregatilineales bacterium SYSU G02658]
MRKLGWLMLLGWWVWGARAQDVPLPMPMVDLRGQNVVNVLLLGLATHNYGSNGLTDSLILISFNRDTRHAAVVYLPRDLYVYLPHTQRMAKLNQAYYYGQRVPDDGYSGVDELKATIRYNLGVEVHYTARVNFGGFVRLIDSLGGVDISVDCAIQDWRLISPELDRNAAENYYRFTLEQGVYRMDGDTALWYVRTRMTSTDLDRGRRQQDVLRAIWRRVQARGLLETLPTLWASWEGIVTTDMPLDVALSFVPDLIDFSTSDISYFSFRMNHEITRGYTPDADRRFIFIMDREAVAQLMREVIHASAPSRVQVAPPTVALINSTNNPDYDFIAQIAADRLELEGFRAVIVRERTQRRNWNHIIDHTGDEKGGHLGTLMRVLATTAQGVSVQPDPMRSVDYTVYLGYNYLGYACTRPVLPPVREVIADDNG